MTYLGYADDSVLLAKEEHAIYMFRVFEMFHNNLKLTIDRFTGKKVSGLR